TGVPRLGTRASNPPKGMRLSPCENPKVGSETLGRRQLFASTFLAEHCAGIGACNRKLVTRPFPAPDGATRKASVCRPFNSGGGIRTRDLRVMRELQAV